MRTLLDKQKIILSLINQSRS